MRSISTMRRKLLRGAVAASVLGVAAGLFMGGSAQAAGKLEQLKEQGFARIAIANEPPWTEVKADGKVTGAAHPI